ncbi:hypothetical protein HYFRA_00006350 [Hymenoscyphus fraxineus]|uniref:alpha-L-rhamnosidase n=1 Tax=Hymenoscyphus fraxineus TaxID=746836 RepID=A0A9N9KQL5_9HELO|nr:hypothetical protein HYFRA_00006350 [Hymenoscyphus fraxineus]
MTVSVSPPTFEHHRENLGIGERSPRISWRFTSDGDTKNWIQESYEIEISRASNAQSETFRVSGDESILVPWPTAPLGSRERARVRVRATGSNDETTEWSEIVEVEAGLQRDDWTARVITAENRISTSGSLQPVSKKVATARLYITSYGVYEATINGVRVGDHVLAPGWTSYRYRLQYQTHDVTELLKDGENVIGIEVGEGWYCGRLGFEGGRRFIYGDQLAALAQLEIVFEDDEKLSVGSDESWKSSTGPIIASELYDGEIYDYSAEVKGWTSSEFRDSEWKPVQVLEFPKATLLAPQAPPIRKIETLRPKKIWRSPSDKVIVDFGQNLVGGVRFRTTGSKGHKIVLTHTEVLEHGEVATRPLRDAKAMDTIVLSGESIEWEPKFTFHGFQYVQVEGWPSESGTPSFEDIEAVVIHTDMEQTGWFECSEPMVNQLYRNIHWGMRGNFVGIPTDCPQRDERLGWTGDIQIFSPTANFLYDTSGMLWSWLQDLSVEQIEEFDGVVPQVVPNVIEARLNKAQAVWGDVSVITPWDLFLNFGDMSILESQFLSMKAWWNGIPKQENGLWDHTMHQLGDWLDPAAPAASPADGRTDPHFIANAYLVHITKLIGRIAGILGQPNERQKFEKMSVTLKSLFRDTYITPAGRLAPDTMTSLSLALEFDLFRNQEETKKARARLARLSRASRFRIGTGFVGTPMVLPALTSGGDNNYKQIAYRMLLEKRCPSWLYPITMGATTMWERWDSMLPNGDINPGSMTSFNHYALGSVGKWLFGCVGGVDFTKPDAQDSNSIKEVGWRKIKFAPLPGGPITKAKTSHLGPYGLISCEWELNVDKGVFKMVIVVPPNSTGIVELPGKSKSEVIEVGSGRWEFEYDDYKETAEWPPKAILDPFVQYEGEEEKERLGR